jgi:membrane protease YdiL (CAAX protease family)
MFGTIFAVESGRISLPEPIRALLTVGSPTISAIVTARLFEGWAGVRRILLQYARLRVPARWYLFGLVFFAVPLSYGLVRAWMGYVDPQGLATREIAELMVVTMILGPISEEGGWRGYALPKLMERVSPIPASVLLGIVWGAWHTPFWFVEGSYQQNIPFLPYVGISALLSIIYARVYLSSRGSLVPVILLHFWINLAGAVLLRRTQLLENVEFLLIEASLITGIALYMASTWNSSKITRAAEQGEPPV